MREQTELLNKASTISALREKWVSDDGKIHCLNCGCVSHIRWHHLVPLGKGGNDVLSNIVPVCDRCHLAIHSKAERHYSADRVWGGRPRKIPYYYKAVLHDYVNCQIGKAELMYEFGIKCKQITLRTWFREYLDEHGIESVRNNVDTIIANGNREPLIGEMTGYITFKDGTRINCYKEES